MIQILRAVSREQIAIARELFVEYAQSLNVSLCFENLDTEVSELPGPYAPPDGCLLLAEEGTRIAGCVALKKVDNRLSEMKRLYVRGEFRGKGLGKKLTMSIGEHARKIGYERMRLDTLPSMKEAIALYRSLGFVEIPPYRDLPVPGALFMEITL
ncbi:MAG: GNAT family N-acetyltransferase [Bacteroidota bacterium]